MSDTEYEAGLAVAAERAAKATEPTAAGDIDRLRIRASQLLSGRFWHMARDQGQKEDCREAGNQLAEIAARIESRDRQAAGDTKRLDWIASEHASVLCRAILAPTGPHWRCETSEGVGRGKTPREAIDAAMAPDAGEKGGEGE